MSRLADYLERNYIYIVMLVVATTFVFGGIASINDKSTPATTARYEQAIKKKEHRTTFFNKYKTYLPQFMDEGHFGIWLDTTDDESIVLLHSLVEVVGSEYEGDDGFAYMVDFLQVAY